MNKKMYKTLSALLYCCGFPALAITSLVISCHWNSFGMYGAGAFAPFIFVMVLWGIVAATKWITIAVKKKKNKEINYNKICITGAILTVVFVFGIFLILQGILPPVLNDATSGTILYEDVIDNADGQHELLLQKVNKFKKINNLGDEVKYSDKEFQDRFNAIYPSMDKAYNSFDKLSIDLALRYSDDLVGAIKDEKIPVNVVASLLLKTNAEDLNLNNHNLTIEELINLNKEEIYAGLTELLINKDNIKNPEVLNNALNKVILCKEFDGIKWNVFQILGENPLSKDVSVNDNIVKTVKNEEGKAVTEDLGACLGYQDMAWLNGLPQMFFIPLMSFRNLLFAFALAIALILLLLGVIKTNYNEKFGIQMLYFDDIKAKYNNPARKTMKNVKKNSSKDKKAKK